MPRGTRAAGRDPVQAVHPALTPPRSGAPTGPPICRSASCPDRTRAGGSGDRRPATAATDARAAGAVGILGRRHAAVRRGAGRIATVHGRALVDLAAAVVVPGDVADAASARHLEVGVRVDQLRDRQVVRIVAAVPVLRRVTDRRRAAAEPGRRAGAVAVAVQVLIERGAGVRRALRGQRAGQARVEEARGADARVHLIARGLAPDGAAPGPARRDAAGAACRDAADAARRDATGPARGAAARPALGAALAATRAVGAALAAAAGAVRARGAARARGAGRRAAGAARVRAARSATGVGAAPTTRLSCAALASGATPGGTTARAATAVGGRHHAAAARHEDQSRQ